MNRFLPRTGLSIVLLALVSLGAAAAHAAIAVPAPKSPAGEKESTQQPKVNGTALRRKNRHRRRQ